MELKAVLDVLDEVQAFGQSLMKMRLLDDLACLSAEALTFILTVHFFRSGSV
jgi:hypothetical protein